MHSPSTRQHHPYSPSKLQALEASPLYESGSEETEAALTGTLQHAIVEEEHLDIDDDRLLDTQYNAIQACRNYRNTVLQSYAEPPTVLKEAYLRIDDEEVQDDRGNKWDGITAGYLDLAFISADELKADLLDWKFGFWSVEPAETNLQGIAYLLSLVKRYPKLETVTVHFVMPHRDEIDSHTFYKEQFPALYLRIKTVVARAIEARRLIKETGQEQCNVRTASCLFCQRLGRCQIAAALVLKVSRKYQPIEVPAELNPSVVTDTAQSTQRMELATLMDAWAKATKRQMVEYAIDNKDWVPDHYVMQERSNTEIKDYEAVRAAARLCGVTDEQLKKAEKIGMTELHKAIMDAQPRGEKDAAIRAFTENLLASGAAVKEPPTYFFRRLKS